MKLIVVGSSNVDLIMHLPKIPRPGETILGGKFSQVFGGKGANQAVAAAMYGSEIGFITKLGNDTLGEEYKQYLFNLGLPPKMILQSSESPSGIAQIWVSEGGENSIGVASGANAELFIKDIMTFESEIAEAEVILTQLETPIDTVTTLAHLAQKHRVKMILNPAPMQNLSPSLLSRLWMITPNEHEAEMLTGIKVSDASSAQKAAKQLLQQGIKHVIITMGSSGCYYMDKESFWHCPAYKVKTVDTTAAGDVFNGVLAASLVNGDHIKEAVNQASAAAALSVQVSGAQPSIPEAKSVELFIKQQNSL